ncbi:hypothetical protein MtrunA17_Chr7g0226651 [Medicago truncatula]|uniref:Uncharacterized protein n=1 Tax=Medicago truncatula TaxID=3880 RepID=A0A396GVI1_MEDTR|nr:hypothetical protein MtrunA17_Chr7g0226651 [Medicago truncatula]
MSSVLPTILPYPNPNFIVTITKEEFILFHSVDRKLFSRLVVELGRDTSQSIHVMAFIMWIERKSKKCNLVEEILQSWPNVMLSNLADEVVVILNCIEISHYPNTFVGQSNLPLIQHILCRNLTLEFFHKKRLEVINDVTKLINDVCVIAFEDIIEQVQYTMAIKMQQQMLYSYPNNIGMVPQQIQPDVREILANLNLDDIYACDSSIVAPNDDKRNEIKQPIDDRTIFMTFSKGYPIYESELREFITRY